jgi:hypothetical protein
MSDEEKTRQEQREERARKEKERLAKHGKGLGKVYKDAVEKRLKAKIDSGPEKK